ncbi:Integrase catalytic core protein [Phytophthora palmivora]|uniref:Integrase catalytic core protein n=1 Tax=Phytophthora palmivora TaxID=4796 RepID=A0A2P4XVE1_9STRA|nr:Integrase catalytic core protein [Phytophthora palmivora]
MRVPSSPSKTIVPTTYRSQLALVLENAHRVRVPIGEDWNKAQDALTELLSAHGGAGAATVKTFQSLVGSLLWITQCTRPDVAFAVHKITRRTNAPTLGDWKLAKRELRFLARTSTLKLHMKGNGGDNRRLDVVGYCDADYAGDKTDRKSTTGGLVTVDGMAVSWVCKKQGGVSLSTMEAEYTAAAVVTQELLGVRELLGEMKVSHEMSMQLYRDNQAALKHIEGEHSSDKALTSGLNSSGTMCDEACCGLSIGDQEDAGRHANKRR